MAPTVEQNSLQSNSLPKTRKLRTFVDAEEIIIIQYHIVMEAILKLASLNGDSK
jgi:hypothetical protein